VTYSIQMVYLVPQLAQTVTYSGGNTGGGTGGITGGITGGGTGVIAGGMTRSNRVGALGGADLPPVRESFTAFAAGVRAVNQRASVVTSYIGNWDDVKSLPLEMMGQ